MHNLPPVTSIHAGPRPFVESATSSEHSVFNIIRVTLRDPSNDFFV
jgi:hypothetical protein